MFLRIFRMLSRCAVEIHTLPVNQEYSLNILLLKDYWGPSFISQRQTDGPPNIWDTSSMSRNLFAHPQASSSAPYPQELNSTWKKTFEEPIHMSTAEKSGRPERDQDLRCQSGTVSQRFSHLQWRRLLKELWGRPTTIADFGSSFWQIPYTSNLCLLEDKVQDRGMYLLTISYGSNAMDRGSGVGWFSGWIEIFVIYSWYFNAEFFEVLDARIASALNKIIHNSHFKRKISVEEQKPRKRTVSFEADRLPTWYTINSGSLEPMILSKTSQTCSLLFLRTWRYSGIRF